MREILTELKMEMETSSLKFGFGMDWEKLLAEKIWKKFYEERDKGTFRVKILFFTKDISGLVAGLLMKWFGPDPVGPSGF